MNPSKGNGNKNGNGSNGQNGESTALETHSARFVAKVEQEFAAQMGSGLKWTDYQKTLAQHLFLKCDMQFKTLDATRQDKNPNGTPITWENVNLQKLALDGVHRVCLGLDALMRNHIHPVPYFNKRTGKYDVDLGIGYEGKDYCRRKLAVVEPVEVIYQLVHETDTFTPYMKDQGNEVETYEFKINEPFNRGDVVGGFGYIKYQDSKLNRLVIITQRDFERSKKAAPGKTFWERDDLEMRYKTIVHRTTEKVPMDPAKANAASYAYVEAQEAEADMERQIADDANGPIVDVDGVVHDEPQGQDTPAAGKAESATEPEGPKEDPEKEAVGASPTSMNSPGF